MSVWEGGDGTMTVSVEGGMAEVASSAVDSGSDILTEEKRDLWMYCRGSGGFPLVGLGAGGRVGDGGEGWVGRNCARFPPGNWI